jgi:outer membrane immunogenic protein
MRKLLLSAVALAAFTGAALAADLPSRKEAPVYTPTPALTWEGFYVGGDLGGAWTTDNLSETSFFPVLVPSIGYASMGSGGIAGGVHVGYNWQTGALVYGLETDFILADVNKNSGCLIGVATSPVPGSCFTQFPFGPYGFTSQLPWEGTLRARVGYAMMDKLLVYATGGLAYAGYNTNYWSYAGKQSFNQTPVGFAVGGGFEYALTANWIARLQYLYSDFGTVSTGALNLGPNDFFWNGYQEHHNISLNTVLVGLSYKFGAAPVLAKY